MEEKRLSTQSVQELSKQFLLLLQSSSLLSADYIRALSKELDEKVFALLQSPKPQIMVYGIYNSGKSTLVNALCERDVAQVADRPMTDRITEYDNGQYILIDSPGIDAPEEHERIADERLSRCHIILFVISSKGGFESRRNYEKMWNIIQMGVPFYIVLNDRGVQLPNDPAEKKMAQHRHNIELEEIRRKIIHNLIQVSKDKRIDQKYDVIVLNARRAWLGIERRKQGLIDESNICALRLRINDILERGDALTWLKAPLATLDGCISRAESQIYALSGGNDYASEREVLQAKIKNTRNSLSDQIRNLVYSRFDSVYSFYCGTSTQGLDQICAELADEVQRAYDGAVEPLSLYVKQTFPNLRKTPDGRFTCVPLNHAGAPAAAPTNADVLAANSDNFFSSSADDSDHSIASGVLEAAGAAALGAASTLGSTAIGTAMTEAAATALGPAAIGSVAGVVGTAGGALSSVISPVPPAPIIMLGLRWIAKELKSASKRKQEEEARYRQMQAEVEAANQKIMENVAEQARIRQDARTKANGDLDSWTHQLRVAAETQLDQTAMALLQALDGSIMQQQQTEEMVQQLLRKLCALRKELNGLRLNLR